MNFKKLTIKNRKKWIAGGCTAVALALAVTGWNILAKGQREGASPSIEETKAVKSDLSKSIQGTGIITPENSVNINVPTGIRITEIRAKVGDVVKAGDVLALTDGTTVTAELLAAREKLAEIEKNLKQTDSKKAVYYTLAKTKQNLEEKINILNKIAENNSIAAVSDGTITAVNGQAGEVNKSEPKGNSGNYPSSNTPSNSPADDNGSLQNMNMNLSDTSVIRLNEIEKNNSQSNEPAPIEFPDLKLPVPVTGQPQVIEIKETESYTGKIEWNKPGDVYAEDTVYAARITLTAKSEYCFAPGTEPKIEGAAVSDVEYQGEENIQRVAFTAIFPKTEAEIQENENTMPDTEPNPEPSDPEPPKDPGSPENPPSSGNGDQDGNAVPNESLAPGGTGGSFGGGNASSGPGDDKEVNTELVAVFSISSGKSMKVNIQVDEMDILSVSLGQKANIVLNALPGEIFEGKITHINKVGKANSGVTKYPVEITANKNDEMLSGMNASASVLTEERKNVLTVPAEAISEEGGKSYVYTSYDQKTGMTTGKKEVTTGLTDGVNIEVIKGLKEGETIFYQGSIPSTPEENINDAAVSGDQIVM
ncbi:MAG: biotin/lipoyl-binding protein [Clostridium sp.]|nr:biotin/lipoyl-binding protein [Clostridium sp.]